MAKVSAILAATIVIVALVEKFISEYWLLVPTYYPMVLIHYFLIGAVVASAMWIVAEGLKQELWKTSERATEIKLKTEINALLLFAGILFLLPVVLLIEAGTFRTVREAEVFRGMGKVEISKQKIPVADIRHIRLVPESSARWIGNQVIGRGNLGALYEFNHYEIQRVKNTLYWVAPLEARGFFAWRKANYTSPGYVMVNAEDPNAPPKLITGYKMRYTWGAWWGLNPQRHAYFAHKDVSLLEITFEVDDNGRPFYVISCTRPESGFYAHKLMGIVILDPQTGEMKWYETSNLPAWVDRAFPKDLALDYSSWWGKFVHGWWNSIAGQKDVQQVSPAPSIKEQETSAENIFLVYNSLNSHPIWIAGMTSPSIKDVSLTGYMTADSISGKMVFYPVSGCGGEEAAISAAEAAPEVAIQKNYHAEQPILYNIYGVESWVVPILSSRPIVEKVAIVYAPDCRKVAVGNTKEEALLKYKELLVELRAPNVIPTQKTAAKEQVGRVERVALVGNANTVQGFFTLVEAPGRIFECGRSTSPEILLTQAGDHVRLSYYETDESIVPVFSFDNLNLGIKDYQRANSGR